MTEMPPELAAVLSRLTPEQQRTLLAILQSAQDEEIFHHELAQQPELQAALQSAIVNVQFGIPVNLEAILQELAQPLRSLREVPRRIMLSQQALLAVTKEENPRLWGFLHDELANSLRLDQQGPRGDNLERAIAHYQQVLEVFTRVTFPEQWAATQNNLANTYNERIRGERADNLERAIYHYEQALMIYSRENFSQDWAMIQNNLANIYRERICGERADNLEQAIHYAKQALIVRTRKTLPQQWAMTQHNLAAAYSERIRGKRSENLENAIVHYQQALSVRTREAFPQDWAMTQNNLASAHRDRICGERADNLEQAIAHYQLALNVYTREAFPEHWAKIQSNLGTAYHERIRGERADNLEQAIDYFEQALEVFTHEAFPKDWALVQNNIATAYNERIRGERADNLEQAIHCFEQALNVFTREAFPKDWALVQSNLGTVYNGRIRGERADNLEQAIAHYQLALNVYTREAFPKDWARTQHNLANAYCMRICGERADNLEQAIDHFEQALEVFTHEAFPEHWAKIQNDLGTAYRERILDEGADNLEQAIHCFEQALNVLTREAFPKDWALVQSNLGTVYNEQIRGERADNLEQAIHCFEQALNVFTREAFPKDWARIQNNLANAYYKRIQGEHVDNQEQAIHHAEQALTVRTQDRFPAEHRTTQRNLGYLHFAERRWEQAYTAYAAAIKAGDALLAEAYTETGRRAEVWETSRLYAATTYCLLRLERATEALIMLEQGKTRLLVEALALSEADLASLPEAQRQALQAARQTVRELEAEMRLSEDISARRNDRELAEALRQTRANLQTCIENIRTMQPEFMQTGLDLPDLLQLIPTGGALVAPLVTSQGSAVFVLPHGINQVAASEVVWLDHLTYNMLRELLRGPSNDPALGGWFGAYIYREHEPDRWLSTIEATGQRLWGLLFEPVHERLQALGLHEGTPVVLMPQEGLGLLPLHAVWREVGGKRRYLLDDYMVSYAPSGYAFYISQRRMQEPQRQQHSLLAVVNPTSDLAFTPYEGEAVAALFDPQARRVLKEKEASSAAVIGQSLGQSYLHFSCHGFYHWQDIMRSGLVLAGGTALTLSEIIARLNLDAARLVTLSACETGLTDFRQSLDEYLGLPAGFLQAGAPAVISTLWAVNDLSTMLLMEHCYHLHLHEGLAIPEALRQAQIWLRDVTAGELAQYFYEVEEKALQGQTSIPIDMASNSFDYFMSQDPEYRPFAHPYYWAAFTFSGA